MLTDRRKSSHNGSPRGMPLAIMALVAADMLIIVACGSDAPVEELNSVMKNLEAEKTASQALRSELAMERTSTTRLVETVDRIEARIAELESQLSKERAAIAKTTESADKSAAQAALLAAFLAWNRKDQDGFTSSFTDRGISETSLSVPDILGQPPLSLRRLMDATVTEDKAVVHAMFALGTQRNSIRYSMARQDGVWKIAGEERLSPKVHGDVPIMELKVDGCSRPVETEAMISQKVAFRLENSSKENPHLILKRVPDGIEPGELLQDAVGLSEGVEDVAFVRETKTGETINVAFTEPLQPGRYVLLCYPQEPGGINRGQPPAAILATYTVK